jgi:hypothetical protein
MLSFIHVNLAKIQANKDENVCVFFAVAAVLAAAAAAASSILRLLQAF